VRGDRREPDRRAGGRPLRRGDYANGVAEAATPVEDLLALIERSTEAFSSTLAAALPKLAESGASPAGVVYRFEG
jgi:hypothetical protein